MLLDPSCAEALGETFRTGCKASFAGYLERRKAAEEAPDADAAVAISAQPDDLITWRQLRAAGAQASAGRGVEPV